MYVIDDDEGVRNSTVFLLATLGYDCVTFAGAAPFLDAADALPRGCVLTDLRMPDMDGFELAEALRRRGVGWPVLLITSDSGGRLDRRAAQLGFAGVLQKPLDADRLDEALASAFADFQR